MMMQQQAAKRPRFASGFAAGGAPGQETVAEVRFSNPEGAANAVGMTGYAVDGATVSVQPHAKSKDGTKVTVTGLTSATTNASLKAFFAECGEIMFCEVKALGQTPCCGSVRFETAQEAAQCLAAAEGADFNGYKIAMRLHPGSKDGTKLQIYNLPPCLEWQELRDYFRENGYNVVYAATVPGDGVAISAEIRFEDAQTAVNAAATLNGSVLGGSQINVNADPNCQDGTKVLVTGVPPGIEWQELKDHFGQIGTVAFVATSNDKGKGKGRGQNGGGKGQFMNMMQGMMQSMAGGKSNQPSMAKGFGKMGGHKGNQPSSSIPSSSGGFGGGNNWGNKKNMGMDMNNENMQNMFCAFMSTMQQMMNGGGKSFGKNQW